MGLKKTVKAPADVITPNMCMHNFPENATLLFLFFQSLKGGARKTAIA